MERISIFKVKYTSQIVDYPSKEFDKYSSKISNLFRVREPSKRFDFSILGKCKLLILKNEISNMIYGLIVMHDFGSKYNLFIYYIIGNPNYKDVNVPLLFKFFDYASFNRYMYTMVIFPRDRRWLKYIFKREGYQKFRGYSKINKDKKYYIYKKKNFYII